MMIGKTCLQILYAESHFVTSIKRNEDEFVTVYNSLSQELHPLLLLQLHCLYADEGGDGTVKVPVTAAQPLLSNLCAVMSCAFVADVLSGRCPTKAIYVAEKGQREWLCASLMNKEFSVCPRETCIDRTAKLTVPKRDEYVITAALAASIRATIPVRQPFGNLVKSGVVDLTNDD